MDIHLWKYRTTFVKIGEQWEMCNFQKPLEHCQSLEELLLGVVTPVPVLTIMHRSESSLERCGIDVQSEFRFEAPILPEVHEPPEVIDLPMEDQEEQPPLPVPAPPPGVMVQDDDHVAVEGIRLGPDSSSAALKAACKSLGIGMSGGKAQLFKRFVNHMKCRNFKDFLSPKARSKGVLPPTTLKQYGGVQHGSTPIQ